MGFRVLLIAVDGMTPDEVHRAYNVEPTEETSDWPDAPVNGASLPNGKYLLYINDEIVPSPRTLRPLSENALAMALYANETTMSCMVQCWKDTFPQWNVYHESEEGLDHLDEEGVVPEEFEAIRDDVLKKHREDDAGDVDHVFEAPIELFVALGGRRYDDASDGLEWTVLKRV